MEGAGSQFIYAGRTHLLLLVVPPLIHLSPATPKSEMDLFNRVKALSAATGREELSPTPSTPFNLAHSFHLGRSASLPFSLTIALLFGRYEYRRLHHRVT